MNYIGSKYSLLSFLDEEVLRRVDLENPVFLDIFSGTGIVGWHFKQRKFRVVANDIQYYSYCLNWALVKINKNPEFLDIIKTPNFPRKNPSFCPVDAVLEYLNSLKGEPGFIYLNYCPGGTGSAEFKRQYFSDQNGKRCDAIRIQIENWWKADRLAEEEYFYLLACLVDAADRVANTASVYGSFLKYIKKTALKPLWLKPLPIVESDQDHLVCNCDGSNLVGKVSCDVLYMDPPYNHRQYCANYHVLETIARYDNPELRGVTGLRSFGNQKSDFCLKKQALPALEEMLRKTKARFVFLSYNTEGIMRKGEILSTMKKIGKVELVCRDYPRFRSDTDHNNRVYKTDRVIEYLFCLDKE